MSLFLVAQRATTAFPRSAWEREKIALLQYKQKLIGGIAYVYPL